TGNARVAVVAAERDEHLVRGRDATAQRTCVADAVVGPGRAVTLVVVGLVAGRVAFARCATLRFVQAHDALVLGEAAGAGDETRAARERPDGRRNDRRRVPLHVARIGVTVVVERAELERPLRRIGIVQLERIGEAELRRIVVLRGDRDRSGRFGDAGAGIGRSAPAAWR